MPLDSRSLDDFTGTNTPSTCLDVLRAAVDDGPHSLKIRKPTPPGQIVGVRNVVAGHRTLAANIASLRHDVFPPLYPNTGARFNTIGPLENQVFDPKFGTLNRIA